MASVSALDKNKIVFLGDQSIGKTSIINRIVHSKFNDTYKETIGIDFLSKRINVEDRTVRLQLWDTAGHERFRSSIPNYIRDYSVAVVVYDVASRQSFLNTTKWIENVRTEKGSDIIFLVGNNADLVDQRQVSIEEGEAKARDFNAMFIETSAKTNFNIEELFEKIAEALLRIETLSSTEQEEIVHVNHQSALDKYKLVFLGEQCIGKTSIISRFVHGIFNDTYQVTIGVDLLSKIINVEDQTVSLKLWDTAGYERYSISMPGCIRDSSVAVIVYDVASRQSFLNTTKWVEYVRRKIGSDVIIFLVGNKADLVDKRKVSIEEGEAKARDFSVMFIETSAKTNFNIKELFEKIVEALQGIETLSSTERDEIVDVDLKSQSQQRSGVGRLRLLKR